jgi:hypothetical protein
MAAVVLQAGGVVDDPVRDAVVRSSAGEVREAAAVLDPAEQDRLVADPRRPGVHHRVDGVRPALRREHRIPRDGA